LLAPAGRAVLPGVELFGHFLGRQALHVAGAVGVEHIGAALLTGFFFQFVQGGVQVGQHNSGAGLIFADGAEPRLALDFCALEPGSVGAVHGAALVAF
jgi:hypothetical protein